MIHTGKNCQDRKLVDAMGRTIPAMEFNDETMEVKIYIPGKEGKPIVSEGKMLTTTITIPDAKLVPITVDDIDTEAGLE